MGLNQLIKKLAKEFDGDLSEPVEFRGETTIRIHDPSKTALICRFAKESLGFDYLVDLSGVDHYGEDPRFEVVYELHGYGHHHYLRLKTRIPEESPEVPSVSGVWRTADWHEREAYDMFGIRFAGHPDLRRILMWEGYPYFPLRKDFPLAGKSSELPEVAFSKSAPMDGGPFVTASEGPHSTEREPRSRG